MNKTTICTIWLVLVVSFFTAACVVIPPLGRKLSKEDIAAITVGETTRSEVIERLGKANVLDERRFLVYEFAPRGYIWVIGAVGGVTFEGRNNRILLEFGADNVVKRYAVEGDPVGAPVEPPVGAPALGETPRLLRTLIPVGAERHFFASVAFSPDGRKVAAGDNNGRVWLKDLDGSQQTFWNRKRSGSGVWTPPVAFLPDGKRLAAGGNIAKVWDTVTTNELVTFVGHGRAGFLSMRAVTALACAPNNSTVITGGWQGAVKLWDAASGRELASLDAHEGVVTSVAVSPDGRLLATAEWGKAVKIWDIATRTAVATVNRKFDADRFVVFSPDGAKLAIASSSHVEVWRVSRRPGSVAAASEGAASSSPLTELIGVVLRPFIFSFWGVTYGTAFSPDGKWLAIANDDRTSLWDLNSWRSTPSFAPGTLAVAFSPDGRKLGTAGEKGVQLWSLEPLLASER